MARPPPKIAQVKVEFPMDVFEDLRALDKERHVSVTWSAIVTVFDRFGIRTPCFY
jgi:hypothetical protein